MTVPSRTFIPARQPQTCNCGWPHDHFKQDADLVFRCTTCRGYLGYCGPNGCDTGVPHKHWQEGA
jgi:hypothetical protein